MWRELFPDVTRPNHSLQQTAAAMLVLNDLNGSRGRRC